MINLNRYTDLGKLLLIKFVLMCKEVDPSI